MGFVGFVSLGLVRFGGLISNISLGGFIGLGLISRLIGLIGLIGLGRVGIISLVGLLASSACQIIDLVSRAMLSAHRWPHNLVANNIIAVVHKQVKHEVATMLTSANQIARMATL